MRLFCAASLGLLLAGCASSPPAAQTPQQFCDSVANRDPVVKDLILKQVSSGAAQTHMQSDVVVAKDRARRDCLKRQGILPQRGGVEGTPRSHDTILQP